MEPRPTSEPITPPDPGFRFRMFYALWKNAADWQTRGSAVRGAVILAWQRFTRPPA